MTKTPDNQTPKPQTESEELREKFSFYYRKREDGLTFKVERDKVELDSLTLLIQSELDRQKGELIDKPFKFTKAEVDQLLTYCEWAERDGTYYGNRRQFESRHTAITIKLGAIQRKLLRGGR